MQRIDVPETAVAPRAPPSMAPSLRWRHRDDVQGLRAVAILLVMLYHGGGVISGGFTGVDVFFVISGFAITGSLLAEATRDGRIDVPGFYIRRMLRILPALAVMLSIVAVVGTLAAPVVSQQTAATTGVFASFFAANAYLFHAATGGYFSIGAELNPLLHTWTLAVEEQLYLVYPLVLAVVLAFSTRRAPAAGARRLALVIVGAASATSFALCLALSYNWGQIGGATGATARQFAFYASPTRAWEFGLGALVVLALGTARQSRFAATAIGFGGVASMAAGALLLTSGTTFPGAAALLPAVGAAAVITAGTLHENPVGRFLGWRPLTRIGDISYSLYLWHWPLIVFARALWPDGWWVAPVAALVAFVPATLSYRYVEQPLRAHPRRGGRRAFATAAVCIGVPVMASVGLAVAHDLLSTNRSIDRYAERRRAVHLDVEWGCNGSTPLGLHTSSSCVLASATHSRRGPIVLVGDSNAGQFSEAVVEAARRTGRGVAIATFNSCPFVDLAVVHPGVLDAATCRAFFDGTMRGIVRLRPSLVVVANGSTIYVEGGEVRLARSLGSAAAAAPDAKAQLWEAGTRSVLSRLQRVGIPVILVHQVPYVPQPDRCAVLRVLVDRCGRAISRRSVDAELDRARRAEERAVLTLPYASTLDVESRLCDDTWCYTVVRGIAMYGDSHHLSVDASMSLAAPFVRAIHAALAAASRAPIVPVSSGGPQPGPQNRASS